MKRRSFAAALACASLLAVTSLRADVTITSTNSGTGLGRVAAGQSVTFIKAKKMRLDTSVAGRTVSSIFDAEAGKMIILNPEKREATVMDATKLANMPGISPEKITARLTPNGQTKEVAGVTTNGYDLMIAVPMQSPAPGQPEMTMEMSGTVWIAKDAPGTAEYTQFFVAAAKAGMFVGGSGAAVGPQGAAMSQMNKMFADAGGIPYSTKLEMKLKGSPQMAAMMGQMGGTGFETTVVSISTDPVADEKFTIPAGWKTTTSK
ncbi:MAG: hypothetical protein HYX76_05520 [Acidobacteria bacterium]|nr:hypothetical protein [Acidobacteriota bacterium]